MPIMVNATSSTLEMTSIGVPTQHIDREEWVFDQSERLTSTTDTTAAANRSLADDGEGSRTDRVEKRRFSPPVRKDSYSIQLPTGGVKLLQQWECVITNVEGDCVECEMHDLRNTRQPVELAEVYIDEFSDFDKPLLQEGAVFYWSVGHSTSTSGQLQRYSELRVRRMPRLSKAQKKEIAQEAEHLHELLNATAQ